MIYYSIFPVGVEYVGKIQVTPQTLGSKGVILIGILTGNDLTFVFVLGGSS